MNPSNVALHKLSLLEGGLLVLNVGNMQAIQSGFYLLHDKFFEIISNIFDQITRHGSFKHKTVLKMLTVKKERAC
jgi:hypothetical protein